MEIGKLMACSGDRVELHRVILTAGKRLRKMASVELREKLRVALCNSFFYDSFKIS